MIRLCAAFALVCATPAMAVDGLPSIAVITQSETEAAGSARIPTTPWAGTPTTVTEGRIDRQVARIAQAELTTLQLIQPIREAFENKGYSALFTCADAACGGFDFRFQLDLLPAPNMYVDLGDYRYLVMEKAGAAPHTVSILTSRSVTDGFIHITKVFLPAFSEPAKPAPTSQSNDTLDPTGIVSALTQSGHAVLSDLNFETGSSDLGVGTYNSLQALSLWLETNPSARIVLVGHTDSVGALDGNTNLSRRRALSVAGRLADEYGAKSEQIEAAGAGYLAPIASNLTEDGRATNRRVEVVLLSLD